MNIASFDDLLQAARQQTRVQRLLLVLAGAELPENSTGAQRARFEAGQGGALVPLMCVDKNPAELGSFADFKQEAQQFGQPWQLVLASTLSGTALAGPSDADIDAALQRMVESIKQGRLSQMLAFDAQGQALMLDEV